MNFKNNTKWLFWLAAVACVISLAVFSFLLIESSQTTKLAKADGYSADQVIVAVNQERIKNNLRPLTVNPKLMQAAAGKVKDMASKNYFSHISPIDGKKWSAFIKESGYVYAEAGENLANGYDSVESMVTAWMNSPTHRDNILNPNFVETGIAIEYGTLNDYPTIFVAESFGRPEEQQGFVAKDNSKIEDLQNTQLTESVEEKVEEVAAVIPYTEPERKYTVSNTLAEIVAPFPNLASSK